MHRVLTEKDRDLVLSYVAAEPEMSLFIAGDIETMGMEGQLCVWGLAKAASADKDLGAVILRYGDNFVVYSRDGDFDDAEAAVLIDRSMGGDAPGDVNGRADLVARLAPFFPANRLEPCTMASLREVNRDAVGPVPQGVELGLLKAEEVDAWLGLQGTIDEFSLHLDDASIYAERRARKLDELGAGLPCVVARDDRGQIVSTASVGAASSQGAMVIAVATDKAWRGRGLATAVVAELCDGCLRGGLEFMSLFFENPAAARIYRRLGFCDVGPYAMLRPSAR